MIYYIYMRRAHSVRQDWSAAVLANINFFDVNVLKESKMLVMFLEGE